MFVAMKLKVALLPTLYFRCPTRTFLLAATLASIFSRTWLTATAFSNPIRLTPFYLGLDRPDLARFRSPSLFTRINAKTLRTGDISNSRKESSGNDASLVNNASTAQNKLRQLLPRFALYLAIFGVGFRQGGGGKGVMLYRSKTVARRFPLASVLLALVLARELWKSVPLWIKPRFLRRRTAISATNGSYFEDPDDLTSWEAISKKLQGVLTLADTKLAAPMDPTKIRIAFLAMLQLVQQLKYRQAEARDDLYKKCGMPATAQDVDVDLDEMFEFADWAYDESETGTLKENLERHNFCLLRHDKTTLPGYVGHYVAISPERRLALIGVKGTSNIEDMVTDCCGLATSYSLDRPFIEGGDTEIRCHEGVLISSKRLVHDIQPFVEQLLLPSGYKILVCGHSLGAGVAALLAIILRSRISTLDNDNLRVMAFASPPILDYDSALACKPFVTTIVNNSDTIPRSSMSNLIIFVEFLKVVMNKLEERGMSLEGDWESRKKLLQKLFEGKSGDMLMTFDEMKDAMNSAYDQVDLRDPDHLYVPGQVLLMYDLYGKKKSRNGDVSEKGTSADHVHLTDGSAKILRLIDIDERMVTDHLAPAYRSSIKSLLSTMYPKAP